MSRQRKTVPIEVLRAEVNRRNQESTCSAEVRAGWNSVLEMMLFHTGNYNGFKYLLPSLVPAGHQPGIRENRGEYPCAIGADNEDIFKDTDPTRRNYF